MNEKNNDSDGAILARGCDRAEDLIAYLYGEASPAEAGAFGAHADACAVCREELAAFGGVRRSVAFFREEAHALAPSLDLGGVMNADAASPTPARTLFAPDASERVRSARAALREFFSLSPLWLRAGVAAAALVVCGLFALTLARAEVRWDESGFAFRANAPKPEAAKVSAAPEPAPEPAPPAEVYTRDRIEAVVAERVAGEVAAARSRWESENKQPPAANAAARTTTRAAGVVAASAKGDPARRKRTAARAAGQTELASEEEDDLPRLSDLLGGAHD